MATTVDLQLAAVDVTTDDFMERVGSDETLSALGWKNISGISIVTVFTHDDVVTEALAAARLVQAAGFTVLRVHEDRVSIAEIEHRLRPPASARVRAWTRKETFPQPRTAQYHGQAVGIVTVWDWADVVAWLRTHEGLLLDENLPSERQVAEINTGLLASNDGRRM